MKKIIVASFIFVIAAFGANGQVATGNGFTIERSVIAGGGAESSSQVFSVTGTKGQASTGISSAAGFGTHAGGFWTPEQLQPTAASATVSGGVLTVSGNGIRNARVTLTGTDGSSRTVVTGSFGFYRFLDVPGGQTYVISVTTGRFTFQIPAMAITADSDLADVNFIANPL